MGENIQTMGTEPILKNSNIKYGCVFFDDPHEHTNGFASIEGNPAKRIRGTMDLDSDVIWIMNIDTQLLVSSGFANHARFRSSSFLRNSIDKIADFIGLDQDNPRKLAQTIAVVLSNTMAITTAMMEKSFIPDQQLKKNIRQFLWPADKSVPEYALKALMDATVYWTPTERLASFDTNLSQKKIFQIPPIKILKKLMGLSVPAGTKWERIPQSKFFDTIESFAATKHLTGGPFLAKVSLKNIDQQFNHLLNFGAGTKGRREWVTSVELKFLMDMADVLVEQIIVPKTNRPLAHQVFQKIGSNKDACFLSLSYNLFLENLWCAMATTIHPKKGSQSVLKTSINPAIPFIRAIDRDICMHAAYQIEKAGFEIMGYGAGGVYVQLAGDETTEDYLIAAVNSGTIPPLCKKDPTLNVDETIGDMNTPDKILQSLHLNGENKNILDIDQQIKEILT